MNSEFEYLRESNRAKSFNEQMDEYLELERKKLMNSIYNNPPKLVDREKLKIVRESDNQQRVEAKIPQAPKLFDYDSVRMVREDKPVTPITAPKPSYNYAQITPKLENPFTPDTPLWESYNSQTAKTAAKPIALNHNTDKPTVNPFEVKPTKAVNPYAPNSTFWNIHNDLLTPKQSNAADTPTRTRLFTPSAISLKRKNPFTPNSELWRHYDKILNSKQKAPETKPINLKLDVKPAAKPKLENTYTPGTPLWEFYDTILNKKFQKPAAKPTAPTENITLTPPEPNKITQQNRTPNNKPTTPTVKIAEEASSVVTPTSNNNTLEPTILPKNATIEFNKCTVLSFTDKRIDFIVEKGKLQNDEFIENGGTRSLDELYDIQPDWFAGAKITSAKWLPRTFLEGLYKITSERSLSKCDNIQNRVINAFLYDRGKSYIYDDRVKRSALIFDENSMISKRLPTNKTFNIFLGKFLGNLSNVVKEYDKAIHDKNNKGKSNDQILLDLVKSRTKKDAIISYTPNFSNFDEFLTYDTFGLMGGTQKVKSYISLHKINDHTYEAKATMYIMDWYGADIDDMRSKTYKGWSNGLNAFYILMKHYGCKPFVTQIIYKKTKVIDLNEE